MESWTTGARHTLHKLRTRREARVASTFAACVASPLASASLLHMIMPRRSSTRHAKHVELSGRGLQLHVWIVFAGQASSPTQRTFRRSTPAEEIGCDLEHPLDRRCWWAVGSLALAQEGKSSPSQSRRRRYTRRAVPDPQGGHGLASQPRAKDRLSSPATPTLIPRMPTPHRWHSRAAAYNNRHRDRKARSRANAHMYMCVVFEDQMRTSAESG